MVRDEPVQSVRHASADDGVAEHRAVALHEPPAVEALLLRERGEECVRHAIVERKHGQAPAAIEADDGTRRPAAEASAGVVQEDRATLAHRTLSKPSSVARTSEPIVAST